MQISLNIFRRSLVLLVLLSGGSYGQDFSAALDAQTAALEAGADELATDEYTEALDELLQARRDAERGRPERASQRAAAARAGFAQAELAAVQAQILASARTAYREADVKRARKYAPRTMERAAAALARAADTLARDRSDVVSARQLAEEAEAAARLAIEITAVAREKPAVEDLLLRQAADIQRLQGAAGLQQNINRDLIVAVGLLEDEIARLRDAEQQLTQELANSRAFSAGLEEEIRLLDEQLGGASAERRELVLQLEEQARKEEQLAQTKALFTATEAEVFQQSDKIVLRLIGARFPSGSAELRSESQALLDKTAAAIAIYPGATIVVEGHTDSRGGERLNQRLSQNRAETVVNELIKRTAIAPERISASGFGESRPIANNETENGRAQNRRIDVILTP